MSGKRWTIEEETYVRENIKYMSYAELGLYLNKSRDCVLKKAHAMGFYKNKDLRKGKRFGRLVVIKKTNNKNKKGIYFYLCQCDCGNTHTVLKTHLNSGGIKSCGCGKTIANALPPGEATLNSVYKSYKNSKNAKKRGFSITKEELKNLISQDCFYCGKEPQKRNLYLKIDGTFHKWTASKFLRKDTLDNAWIYVNGIDRINNDLGYIKENCVTCCWKCNSYKRNDSASDFIEQAYKIASYQESKKK